MLFDLRTHGAPYRVFIGIIMKSALSSVGGWEALINNGYVNFDTEHAWDDNADDIGSERFAASAAPVILCEMYFHGCVASLFPERVLRKYHGCELIKEPVTSAPLS
ncbi:hypothetical protein EVAR_32557_1 [Eumeta japonica]|uniref:Uncharacterized protein n=1 Tax=Eumeta variegata TaxID=151549 RepID=A0A4C1VTF8_EUMVA|nr:hypothetical protein EVAR_32557_1 [Eumeta japonica]